MKLSEELKRCIEDDACGTCQYYSSENHITCHGLLQKAYEKIKEYEEVEELNKQEKGECVYMGIFKENLNFGLQYAFLLNLGFKYRESNGINGMSGYVKTIPHNENEVLWITVNPQERKVYLYNELDCGGELWQRTHCIQQSALKNETEFVDWLDEKIGSN